ncbi:MAG: tetratricopeptide repeat protein [bacterium]|nr:tetratricopeptide repeat protein [bacterium]
MGTKGKHPKDPSQPTTPTTDAELESAALRRLFRVGCDFLRQLGSGKLTLDDAATRLQVLLEGRTPDAQHAAGVHVNLAGPAEVDDGPSSDIEGTWSSGRRRRVLARIQHDTARGNLTAAIRCCEELIDQDPHDLRMLLKLGDLYAKGGRASDATQAYLRVAGFYVEQGFYLKAVAVYKQVLKIEEITIVQEELAGLYYQLGLVQDAMEQYEQVAAAHDRNGLVSECLAVRRKIVDMDPQNIQSRIRLAEVYTKNGLTAEAVQEFLCVADTLKAQRRTEDWRKVAERIVRCDPSRRDVRLELVRLYLQKGELKRALAKLQPLYKTDPNDTMVLDLLAQAFVALEKPAEAVLVLKELVRVTTAAGPEDVARSARERLALLSPDAVLDDPHVQEAATRMVDEILVRIGLDSADASKEEGAAPSRTSAARHDERHDEVMREFMEDFAKLAKPTLDGPVPALRGFARCCAHLGETGRAIEAYEALLARTLDGDKDDPEAARIRATLAELRDKHR